MAAVPELSKEEKAFLKPYLPAAGQPHITLTYACSLDGMIALAPDVRTKLSGPETSSMTHYLRLHHDAILVGATTAMADDPSLNCRYPGATTNDHPIPVVLNSSGMFTRHWLQDSKMAKLARQNEGKSPHTISLQDGQPVLNDFSQNTSLPLLYSSDLAQLRTSTRFNKTGRIDWDYVVHGLREFGMNSIMIEGGATVISELLSQPDVVDSVIVTIAPTWLGQGGLSASPAAKKDDEGQRINAARLANTAWRQFGQDAVLCGRLEADLAVD